MNRTRITSAGIVLTVCALGGLVLHLLGTPGIAGITIAVLAAAATIFSRWARTLHTSRRPEAPPARR